MLRPGVVYLAPGDAHMEVSGWKGRNCISLRQGEPLHGCRPAADFLFLSAARTFGAGTLAVVLTGMGTDGLDGSQAIRSAGGSVLAQDEATSAVWGMPGRVVAAGLANAVLPVGRIAAALLERTLSRSVGLKDNTRYNPAPRTRPMESPRELF